MASIHAGPGGLTAGEPENQMEWHESYRDFQKNMYRTTYSDMSHSREVHVRSDYPSGFGGHVPSLRHDVLFRNTQFDRMQRDRQNDPNRDAMPDFKDHIAGIPTTTMRPQGAKRPPTVGVVPHDGSTTMMKPPWGVLTSGSPPLTWRSTPPTMLGGQLRINMAAKTAGTLLADPSAFPETPQSARGGMSSRGSNRLKKSVNSANEASMRVRMPTETEILSEEVQF
eukprot:TRINITY_DN32107_c0_g1_i1.p1 TRINITY_DN32107_c0_g1~~TRINITY_DN32107_c0_g1_i1.p1  ORF type:complete len:260 (-),score=24.13 TRINITY_DN32107_c0_g1_i1:128-802(-)